MTPSMIKGPILVKARKIAKENDNDYYLEFYLDDYQAAGLANELSIAHIKNGTLKVVHETNNESRITLIREIMQEHPDMSVDMKEFFLKKIAELV
jgi:hypothetical protein